MGAYKSKYGKSFKILHDFDDNNETEENFNKLSKIFNSFLPHVKEQKYISQLCIFNAI